MCFTAPASKDCATFAGAIRSSFALFFFQFESGHTIWFDSLLLHLDRRNRNAAALMFWEPTTTASSQLWMTQVSFVADAKPGGRAIWVKGEPAMCTGAAHACPTRCNLAVIRAHLVLCGG